MLENLTVHFTSQDFRQALGQFATGVTVVTTEDGDVVHGMTANAFTSVSLEPPLVLVSVDKRASTHEIIARTGKFGINILREEQEDLSRRFSKKIDDMDNDQPIFQMVQGIPILKDCLCSLACTLWATYNGGDHTLYVGKVEFLQVNEGDPLLFFASRYCKIEK